jgi:hypothetical protein
MGAGLAKMLQGSADEASFRQAFARADKNKNGSLDHNEMVAVVDTALELLGKNSGAAQMRLPSANGNLTLAEWQRSGSALQKQVAAELAQVLFAVVDKVGFFFLFFFFSFGLLFFFVAGQLEYDFIRRMEEFQLATIASCNRKRNHKPAETSRSRQQQQQQCSQHLRSYSLCQQCSSCNCRFRKRCQCGSQAGQSKPALFADASWRDSSAVLRRQQLDELATTACRTSGAARTKQRQTDRGRTAAERVGALEIGRMCGTRNRAASRFDCVD